MSNRLEKANELYKAWLALVIAADDQGRNNYKDIDDAEEAYYMSRSGLSLDEYSLHIVLTVEIHNEMYAKESTKAVR